MRRLLWLGPAAAVVLAGTPAAAFGGHTTPQTRAIDPPVALNYYEHAGPVPSATTTRPVLVPRRGSLPRYAKTKTVQHRTTARSSATGTVKTTVVGFSPIWPVRGYISSGFGIRSNPFTHQAGQFHQGWDIAAAYGTPVHAAADGVVSFAGWFGGYGNYVVISHGNGISTTYGHHSRLHVQAGQHVKAGAIIGWVGATGAATGPHLDFRVLVNGTPVNPGLYLH